MSVNFQVPACQKTLNNDLFGLCDDNDGAKAYVNIDDFPRWIATVRNDRRKEITFTAVDKCIIRDNEYIGRGRCDGMLTTDEHLFFVELKDQAKGWATHAVNQLESTIQFFIEANDITGFKHKKAFACNKRSKHFQEIDNELNHRFFRKYRVRIDIQADIIVI